MDELVIVVVVVVVVVVMATPIAAVVALARSASSAEEIKSLRRQLAELNRRLRRMEEGGADASAAPGEAVKAPTPQRPRTHPVGEDFSGAPRRVASRAAPGRGVEVPELEEEAGGSGRKERAKAGGKEARPAPDSKDLETLIGTTWVLRIGLGILAIALALFARTVAPQLSPAAKVAVAYVGAWALFGVGRFYADKLERFARPVMAAGLAFGFFVAFAAYFVPAMATVSLPVSIAWMLVGMGTVLVAAERWGSQPTAALAIFLGHIAGFVATAQADPFALSIVTFLALTAAVLVLRHQWFELGVFTVALTYGAHFLWVLDHRGSVEGDGGFWLNLAFLTSYYVVFLLADVLWWRRHGEGAAPRSGGAAVSPRYLGPTNLVLYVSVTSFVYVASAAHVASIEWYFLSLGAVQGALAWLYRDAHHRDYIFYPAFGTILWTLGMFAALDALSLNLVLAGQALLLLFAAHRTGLWVFHALAQVALLVAFVHYWTYPAMAPSSWPIFLGGLGLVAVYLVKASLEELWYGTGGIRDSFGAATAEESRGRAEGAFRRLLTPVAPFLAHFHAALGGLVLVREGRAHFGWHPGLGVFVALAGALVVGIVMARRRTALLFALSTAAATSLVFVAEYGMTTPVAPLAGMGVSTSFPLILGLAVAGLALGLGALSRLDDHGAREAGWHGRTVMVLCMAGCVLVTAGPFAFAGDSIWLVVPLVAMAFLEFTAGRTQAVRPVGREGSTASPEEPSAAPGVLDASLAVAAALVVVRLIAAGVGMEPMALVWVAGGTVVLMVAALIRGGGAFGVGGYALMMAGYGAFLLSDGPLAQTLFASLWMGSVVTVVPLGVAVVLDARASHGEEDRRPEGEGESESGSGTGIPFHRSDVATLAAYALALPLLGGLAYAQLPVGWAQLMPALFGLVLVLVSPRLGLHRAAAVVLVAMALLHMVFLGRVMRTEAVAGALGPIVMFGVITLAAERAAGGLAASRPGPAFAQTMAWVLVAAATLTVMAAIYVSTLFGAPWATAGWSLLAGSLMGAGFALRSSLHRYIALLVLASCLVRVFLVDTRGLSSTAKTGVFFVLGLSLLCVALLYSKYSERMKDWL